MAISETSICNAALGKLGAKRITNYEDTTESSDEAIQCRLHYEITRDALIRSHFWRFAKARAVLSRDTEDDPLSEWDYQYILPNDYLRFISIDEETGITSRKQRHSIEGQRFFTDYSTVNMRYIRKVTDPAEFDPLFVKVLVWLLADEMIGPLAGGDARIQKKIDTALSKLMPKVWAIDSDETDTGGRSDWNLARHGADIESQSERFW